MQHKSYNLNSLPEKNPTFPLSTPREKFSAMAPRNLRNFRRRSTAVEHRGPCLGGRMVGSGWFEEHLIRNPWELVGWFPNIWVSFFNWVYTVIVDNYTSSIWLREFPESPCEVGILIWGKKKTRLGPAYSWLEDMIYLGTWEAFLWKHHLCGTY